MGEHRGHLRRATWRRARSPGARRARRRAPPAARSVPASTSRPSAQTPNRHSAVVAEQRALGRPGRRTATATSVVRQARDRHSGDPRADVGRQRLARLPAPAPPRRPSRAPPPAGAAAHAARTRGTRRAAANGRAARRRTSPTSRSSGMSRLAVASCLEIRASSACSVRFCLRLAPLISSTDVEHLLERPEALQQLGGGLVADPGDARDVVARVALEADEVGDQLRRDPVALDHALAVVDARVGDPAGGGHDPDAVVDELVGVAVAGDDHHRRPAAPRPRGRARRSRRSRRRPRSPRPAGCGTRTRRPAAPGAATAREQVGPSWCAAPCTRRRPPCGPEWPGVPDDDRRLRARSR